MWAMPDGAGRHMWGTCLVSGASSVRCPLRVLEDPIRPEPPCPSTRQPHSFAIHSAEPRSAAAIEVAR
jgi:hypothetical protein